MNRDVKPENLLKGPEQELGEEGEQGAENTDPTPADEVTRARATPVSPEVKAARVERIAGLMAEGQWVRGKSGAPLALEWGVATQTVEGYAAEASRMVRAALGDLAAIRDAAIVGLVSNAQRASSVADFKASNDAWRGVASIVGPATPARLELTGAGGMPLNAPPRFVLLLESLAAQGKPATEPELEHFASTRTDDDCRIEGCRMHPAGGAMALTGGT